MGDLFEAKIAQSGSNGPSLLGRRTAMGVSGTKSTATTLLAIVFSLSTACTTLRPITADASGEQARLQLKPGDTVHVVTKNGASHTFEVTDTGASSMAGKAVRMLGVSSPEAWGTRIEIPYTDIAQIEVRRVQGLKTIGLIAAVVLADVAIASSRGGHARCCISR